MFESVHTRDTRGLNSTILQAYNLASEQHETADKTTVGLTEKNAHIGHRTQAVSSTINYELLASKIAL